MKSRLALAVATAFAVAGVTQNALAADLPIKAPAPKQANRISQGGFEGIYAGGTVGWTVGSSRGDYAGTMTPTPVYYPFNLKPSGASLGGVAGYNFQSAAWLYGVEGDINWIASANDQAFDPAGSGRYDKIRMSWTAHARGRIGYVLENKYLFYFAGGAAFAGTRNWHYALDTLYDASSTRVGYSLGGGVEAALNSKWLLRAEYLYDHFGNRRFDWTGTRYSNSDLTLNTGRIAIVYRPGG